MTTEQSAALRQISSMLQSGALHGGTITQRKQFVVAIECILAEPLFTAEDMLSYGNERVDSTLGAKMHYQTDDLDNMLNAIKTRKT